MSQVLLSHKKYQVKPFCRRLRKDWQMSDIEGLDIYQRRSRNRRRMTIALVEQHDEWMVCRRYMSLESLVKARMKKTGGNAIEVEEEEVKELVPAAV